MSEQQVGLRDDGEIDLATCALALATAGSDRAARLRVLPPRLPAQAQSALQDGGFARLPDQGDAPDCAACRERCCIAPHRVRLILEDVARLLDAGLGWAVERPRRAGHPPLLAQRGGRCVFLDLRERCGIYPGRPQSCRGFPFQITEDVGAVRFANSCRSRRPTEPGVRAKMIADAVEGYNRRARGLELWSTSEAALHEMGLAELYRPPTPKRSFAAVLAGRVSRSDEG